VYVVSKPIHELNVLGRINLSQLAQTENKTTTDVSQHALIICSAVIVVGAALGAGASFTTEVCSTVSEGEVERNHVLSELSRVGSIYPRLSQGTS
jgi:hypothetical protein